MTEHAHNKLSINPKELSAGSVLVCKNFSEGTPAQLVTRLGEVTIIPHDANLSDVTHIAPIEHVLMGLGLSTLQILSAAVSSQKLNIQKFFVAVSRKQEGKTSTITREVIIDGQASDNEREMLKNLVSECPVSSLLKQGSRIETIIL